MSRKKSMAWMLTLTILLFSPMIIYAGSTGEINGNDISNKIIPADGTYCFIILEIGSPTMIFNGTVEEIDPGRGTAPIIENDRTLLPARVIIEKLGGTTEWIEYDKRIIIRLNNKNVELQINSKKAIVNKIEKDLDTEPKIVKERTMLPLRFIAENLGCKVYWHGNNMISVTSEILKDTFDSEYLTLEELSIYDAVTRKIISLGMTKEEVDNILGKQESKDFLGKYNYSGLKVFYRDNKAVGLVVQTGDNFTNRFVTARNVNFLSSKDYVIKKYGMGLEGIDSKYGTYVYQKSPIENKLVKLDTRESIDNAIKENKSDIYYFSFLYSQNQDQTVSFILIGDHDFAINMK